MEKQLLGEQADLQHNSPLNVEHDGKTGTPEKQLLGEQAPLSMTPATLAESQSGVSSGQFQTLGSQAPLSNTPIHGWTSYPTPPSNRAVKQSQ